MLNFLDLVNKDIDAAHELGGIVVMQDIHINSLISACKKRCLVVFGFDASSNPCQD
jgi:tryptophanase